MIKSIRLFFVAIALSLTLGFGLSYNAYSNDYIYAVDGAAGNQASLHIFDKQTGNYIEEIGPIGYSHVTAIAFHPITGVLYGHVSDFFNSGFTALLIIDTDTGAGTVVGPTNGQFPDFDFNYDNRLYGWNESGDDLYRINTATGNIFLVGDSSTSTATTGLAFDGKGGGYMSVGRDLELYHLDPWTGQVSPPIMLSRVISNMLAIDWDTGIMYSGCRQGGGENCGDDQNLLFTIDPDTGVVTELSQHDLDFLSAIAVKNQGVELSVPTLSEWGMIALAGVIGIAGLIVIRRRKAVA